MRCKEKSGKGIVTNVTICFLTGGLSYDKEPTVLLTSPLNNF